VAGALHFKAISLRELGRWDEEIRTLDSIVARFSSATELTFRSDVAAALIFRGNALGKLGRWDEALNVSSDVLSRFGGAASEKPLRLHIATAIHDKMVALRQLGRDDELMGVYELAQAIFPEGSNDLLKTAIEKVLIPSTINRPDTRGEVPTPLQTGQQNERTLPDAPNKDELLNRYRIHADEPIAVTLAFMGLQDRDAFLDFHYPSPAKWADVRSKRPTPSELLAWAENNFPDRNELGLVQRDLKHLDKDAYAKLMEWSRTTSNVKLPKKFGFSLKDENFSATIAKNTPTAKEVQESVNRGSPDAGKLLRRYQRGQYHIMKMDIR
jgi:tetratricopeptide (TPR) repeat protein